MRIRLENKHILDLEMEYIPLEEHNCYMLSMFKNSNYKNYDLFQKEYSEIFDFFNNLDYHVIFYEKRIEDFEDIKNLDIISKLVDEDILVIVFNYWKRFNLLL